jgi:hypothetical protein
MGMRLALIAPHNVPDEQLPELLNAQSRQQAYQQAQTWTTMAEMADRDPMPNLPGGARWTINEIFDSAVDEIRAELLTTRRAAESELTNAVGVMALPPVMQALWDGVIDRARAIKFAEGCIDLTDEQTDVLLDELLPGAGRVTSTELAEKIKQVAIALDPEWAKRRYQQAVREKKVVGYLNPDGSATLSGQNLPVGEAAAAGARVDALADAAKRAGAKAKIDHLRADLFLGLLDGRFHGMTQTAIVAELLRQYPKSDESATTQPATDPASIRASDQTLADAVEGSRGVHLRVGLATLLGLDDQPGEIAGWGTVTAPITRTIADRQANSEWRYAILDVDGRLLFDGITRHRRGNSNRGRVPGGIVELHVPLDLLTEPGLASQHPDWSRLLADLNAQFAQQKPIDQDPAARFPGRPLRRHTQTLFQRCIFPGCRRPASDCDLDHRREHARGGATDEANMGPGCRHDHGLKTSRGWRLVRRDDATYFWISPLGRKHIVTTAPVAPPLPKPIPRLLPPDRDYLDGPPEPAPTFRALDQLGRRLASAEASVSARAVEFGPDPPPF